MEVKALQQMMSQLWQMQENLEHRRGEIRVEATAGGGMVAEEMNGQKPLTVVKIEPDIFAGKDQEMLQDLVLAAVNEASRRADEELAKQVKDMAGSLPGVGGMRIPGLF